MEKADWLKSFCHFQQETKSAVPDAKLSVNNQKKMKNILGIHVGNYSSCLSLYRLQDTTSTQPIEVSEIEIVNSSDGDRLIPSLLGYRSCNPSSIEDILFGTSARQQRAGNMKNTLSHFMHFLARPFEDLQVESVAGCHNMRLVRNEASGHVDYVLSFRGDGEDEEDEERAVPVHEALATYLQNVKETAESFIGTGDSNSIDHVAFVVPVQFSAAQKDALVKCCRSVGLQVANIIPEPVAVLAAYPSVLSLDNGGGDMDAVVVDIGSFCTTASMVAVRSGVAVVTGVRQSADVSGDAFTDVLADHFAQDFARKYKMDPRESRKSMVKLRSAVEVTKKTLAKTQNAHISIESLLDGVDFHSSIHRMRFETLCSGVFSRLREFLQDVSASSSDKGAVRKVYLVGGSAHLPGVAAVVGSAFKNVEVIYDSLASELPAIGAVMDTLHLVRKGISNDYSLPPVANVLCPFRIGVMGLIENEDGTDNHVIRLVDAYQPLPVSKTLEVRTSFSNPCGNLTFIDEISGKPIASIDIENFNAESMDVWMTFTVTPDLRATVTISDDNQPGAAVTYTIIE